MEKILCIGKEGEFIFFFTYYLFDSMSYVKRLLFLSQISKFIKVTKIFYEQEVINTFSPVVRYIGGLVHTPPIVVPENSG